MADNTLVMVGGGDLGNDGLKIVFTNVQGKKERFWLSNALKLIPNDFERQNLSDNEKTLDYLDVHISAPHLEEIHEKRFYVGQFAIKNKEMKYSAETKKTENFRLLVPFLTAIALQAKNPEQKISANFVLGLPIEEYKNKPLRQQYQQKIRGEYTVTFKSTPERRGWKVDIDLDAVTVAEGMSVCYNQILTEDGKEFAHPDWQGDAMGVLDIGAFTTDFAFIDSNNEPDITLSVGIQRGIAHAIDEVCELFRQEHTEITRNKVVEAMAKNDFIVKQGGDRVDLKKLSVAPFTALASDIESELLDILSRPEAREIQRIFVCGGGAIFLQPYFKQVERIIQDKHKIKLIYLSKDSEEAMFQNAEGNKKIAETFDRFVKKIEAAAGREKKERSKEEAK